MRRRMMKLMLGLVPILTLGLALRGPLLECNLTLIGNALGHREAFWAWGAATLAGLALWVGELCRAAGPACRSARLLLGLAVLLFGASLVLPYHPERVPTLSNLHVALAFVSPVALLLGLLSLVRAFRRSGRAQLRGSLGLLAAIVAISLGLLAYAGFVTSLLELFVVCATLGFVWDLLRRVEGEAARGV